jgi:hypothetical protein
VIRLEVYGESEAMATVARQLDGNDDVSRVRLAAATRPEHAVVAATVDPRAADELLEVCDASGFRTPTSR